MDVRQVTIASELSLEGAVDILELVTRGLGDQDAWEIFHDETLSFMLSDDLAGELTPRNVRAAYQRIIAELNGRG